MNGTRSRSLFARRPPTTFRTWRRNTEQLRLVFFRSTATRAFVPSTFPGVLMGFFVYLSGAPSSGISRLRSFRPSVAELSLATSFLPSRRNRDCDTREGKATLLWSPLLPVSPSRRRERRNFVDLARRRKFYDQLFICSYSLFPFSPRSEKKDRPNVRKGIAPRRVASATLTC